MDTTSRDIIKTSLIKGAINKYTAEKETLLAEITMLLEGDSANPDDMGAVFEKKINRLSFVETNLVQMEMMFMGQNRKDSKPEPTDDG